MEQEERPLECATCQRKVEVTYHKLIQGVKNSFYCCSTCPHLRKKLGETPLDINNLSSSVCNHCHTSLESISKGQPVGCFECYKVFEKEILDYLTATKKIAFNPHLSVEKKSSFHVGKSPEESFNQSLAKRLEAFHQSLSEALVKENYEQAAWLRDQIEELQKKTDEQR
ncbi:MAG: UvrB/UvrC motif-containing protein [Simkania negevensis]|nr:UvrB/UvrC motif-containing protein [Simkania negevensis]